MIWFIRHPVQGFAALCVGTLMWGWALVGAAISIGRRK